MKLPNPPRPDRLSHGILEASQVLSPEPGSTIVSARRRVSHRKALNDDIRPELMRCPERSCRRPPVLVRPGSSVLQVAFVREGVAYFARPNRVPDKTTFS
jgi:hypothetical protein